MLKENFRKILLSLVDQHIRLLRPISSFSITRQKNVHLSSSSVRAIFAQLERQGYLFSPHHSAGRVPTSKAYRYYVNHLPRVVRPRKKDRFYVQEQYLKHGFDYQSILETTSRILTKLTKCWGIVSAPQNNGSLLKHIECIQVGADEILVIFLTRDRQTTTHHIDVESTFNEIDLKEISTRLNHMLMGLPCDELAKNLHNTAQQLHSGVANELTSKLASKLSLSENNSQLYKHEFKSSIPYKQEESIYYFLESKSLRRLMDNAHRNREVQVYISDDDEDKRQISAICGSYFFGDRAGGSIGIVGPHYMNYPYTIGAVEFVRLLLSAVLTKRSN